MKPNVMLIQPSFYVYGGAERQIVELCNYLTDRNYRVTIFTTQCPHETRKNLKETRVAEFSNFNELNSGVHRYHHMFEIINPHNHPCELLIYPIKHKTVWQCNEPPDSILHQDILPENEKNIVNYSINKIVVISDFEKERVKKYYGMDAIVNYPGVRFDFINQEKESGIADTYNISKNFTILHPGWVGTTKNQILTVQALAKVKAKIPDAKVLFAGVDIGEYKKLVIAEAEKLGVANDIQFTGYIQSDEDMRKLYYLSKVLVAPVTEQGTWATTFEGIVAKLPVVASNNFVGSNLIRDNKLAKLCSLTSDDFANAILEVYDGNYPYDKEYAKEWIGKNLTWNNFCAKYDAIFEEML